VQESENYMSEIKPYLKGWPLLLIKPPNMKYWSAAEITHSIVNASPCVLIL
jgi:hypothetical protein